MADPVTTSAPPTSTDNTVAQRVTPNATTTPNTPSTIPGTPNQASSGGLFNDSTATQYLPASEYNILNEYRSWTYNFTLGALPPEAVTGEIETLEQNLEKFRVLDSAGKGLSGIGLSNTVELSSSTQGLNISEVVDGFNQNSPGRFDLYIDEVSIDSLIGAGTSQSGSSIASNIEFTVYEPYSMNGFVEALQVAANAAAYPTYMQAVFALRVRFIGYRDDTSVSAPPEVIPNSSRYFCITITTVEVEVTEQGTRYKCTAVPYNQMGFGTPNTLSTDIRVAGNTVHEVLSNFFRAVNTSVKDSAKATRGDNAKHDYYELSCPALVPQGGTQDITAAMLYSEVPNRSFGGPNNFQSDIIKAQMNDELREVNVFQHGDPAAFTNGGYVASRPAGSTEPTASTAPATATATPTTPTATPSAATPTANPATTPTAQPASAGATTPSSAGSDPATNRLVPTQGTVVFGTGRQIHDCITAVVRDSKYVRGDLLTRQIQQAQETGDPFVTYFTVRLEVEMLPEFDRTANKYYCIYRYILEPYRMHYSRIPGYEQGETDYTAVRKQVKREYNYIYSGKNVDVLKFQLKFDSLYYTAIPAMLGNRPDRTNAPQSAGQNNTVEATARESSAAVAQTTNPNPQANPTPTVVVDPSLNTTNNVNAAGQPQADPYYRLAQNIHNAVLNNTDLIQGTLEILGDPYFLVTGGMGNQSLRLASDSIYQSTDGQAPITQGDLVINLNFKTPKDISVGGPNSGFLEFDTKLLPFSGLYRITTLKSSFKGGVFTQAIEVLRCPGQIASGEVENPQPITTSPLAGAQAVDDARPLTVIAEGIRESGLSFANIISRGLPNPGLPGVPSNFSNAILSVNDAFNKVNQLASDANGILNQVSGVTGQLDQLASQIGTDPLSGLDPLREGINMAASAFGTISSPNNLTAAAVTAAGSSIGNIANISEAAVGLATNVADAISSVPGVTALPQQVAALANSNVAGLVNDIGRTVSTIQNAVPTDLTGIASRLGIDPSTLSGLSSELSSKLVSQLQQVADLVPPNTNVTELDQLGVFFDNITGFQLPNLPAIQPQIPAPGPLIDAALEFAVDANGQITGILNGETALAALTEINGVSNAIGNLSAGLDAGLGSSSLLDQLSTIQTQVNTVIGDAAGLVNQVGSLSQNTINTVNPASIGLGSVESFANTVDSIVQTTDRLAASTVNVQFGSRQTQNPLTTLIQNSNIRGSI